MGFFEKIFGGAPQETQPDSYAHQSVPSETGETISSQEVNSVPLAEQIIRIEEELKKLGDRNDAEANELRALWERDLDRLKDQLKPKAY